MKNVSQANEAMGPPTGICDKKWHKQGNRYRKKTKIQGLQGPL